MPDDGVDAQLCRELAALGRPKLFEAVKYSRQQRADLRGITADIVRARTAAAEAARRKDSK